jgi:hypothetical protein
VSGGAGPPVLNSVSYSPQMSISFEFSNGSGFPNDYIEVSVRGETVGGAYKKARESDTVFEHDFGIRHVQRASR